MMENACLSLVPLSLKAERAQWRAVDVADFGLWACQ